MHRDWHLNTMKESVSLNYYYIWNENVKHCSDIGRGDMTTNATECDWKTVTKNSTKNMSARREPGHCQIGISGHFPIRAVIGKHGKTNTWESNVHVSEWENSKNLRFTVEQERHSSVGLVLRNEYYVIFYSWKSSAKWRTWKSIA